MLKFEYKDRSVRFLNPTPAFFAVQKDGKDAKPKEREFNKVPQTVTEKIKDLIFDTGVCHRVIVVETNEELYNNPSNEPAAISPKIPAGKYAKWRRKRRNTVKEYNKLHKEKPRSLHYQRKRGGKLIED